MFEAARDGKIKALWILNTNPAVSMPRAGRVRAALGACPFVAVSDCWPTDTTCFADIVLPAAAWGEKDGTVTNSERCISRQRAFQSPPGEARPDWWMMAEVARRMGWQSEFAYCGAAEIFREHAALSAFENERPNRRIFDIGALADLSDDAYDRLAPTQWPLPRGTPVPSARHEAAVRRRQGIYDRGRPCALHTDPLQATCRTDRRSVAADSQYRTRARSVAHDDPHREIAAAHGSSERAHA